MAMRHARLVRGVTDRLSIPAYEEAVAGLVDIENRRLEKHGEPLGTPFHCIRDISGGKSEIDVVYFTADPEPAEEERRVQRSITSFEVMVSMIEAGYRPLVDPEIFALLCAKGTMMGKKYDAHQPFPLTFVFLGSIWLSERQRDGKENEFAWNPSVRIFFKTQGSEPSFASHEYERSEWAAPGIYFPATNIDRRDIVCIQFPQPLSTIHDD